jgi:hypothetical protein
MFGAEVGVAGEEVAGGAVVWPAMKLRLPSPSSLSLSSLSFSALLFALHLVFLLFDPTHSHGEWLCS